MSTVLRIPLRALNVSALAGLISDGPCISSLYGFVSKLEALASFSCESFGLVVSRYESSLYENLVTSLDHVHTSKQKEARSVSGARYGKLDASLYLKLDTSIDVDDIPYLIDDVHGSLNGRMRIQGGTLLGFYGNQPGDLIVKALAAASASDFFMSVADYEHPLSSLYLKDHLTEGLQGDALLDAFAEKLVHRDAGLTCNGYRIAGSAVDESGVAHDIAENIYTCVKYLPCNALKSMSTSELDEPFSKFFWSFNGLSYSTNKNLLEII